MKQAVLLQFISRWKAFIRKVQHCGIAYQRTLETANLSIGLKASWRVFFTETRENSVVYVTAVLQLLDMGAGVVFGWKQDRPWPSQSGTVWGHFRVHYSLKQNYIFVPPSAEV